MTYNKHDILHEIIAQKRSRTISTTHLPLSRTTPLAPFIPQGGIICEIKRHSPSRGTIKEDLHPVQQANYYHTQGAAAISVLTEPHYFHGSLDDLVQVKKALPHCAILRKDFLLTKEDIDISWRAGADAVLLIASILNKDELSTLSQYADTLGLAVLTEAHTLEDIKKCRDLQPTYMGINARNLHNFKIDLLTPLALRKQIDWQAITVFESGITSYSEALLAYHGNFDALLIGEAAVKHPQRIARIHTVFSTKRKKRVFWNSIAQSIIPQQNNHTTPRPLIKVCGITNEQDAWVSVEAGADLIGFVFAPSKRRANETLLYNLKEIPALKVAIVDSCVNDNSISPQVDALWKENIIDAIQFHGNDTPLCYDNFYPFYRAYNIATRDDITAIKDFYCPRILIDAYVKGEKGGTGKQIDPQLVKEMRQHFPLWLAGGITPDNIQKILSNFHPELIDISSGLEKSPGKKDHKKIKQFFNLVTNICGKKERSLV